MLDSFYGNKQIERDVLDAQVKMGYSPMIYADAIIEYEFSLLKRKNSG